MVGEAVLGREPVHEPFNAGQVPLSALCGRHALGVEFRRYRPQRLTGIELSADGARNGHSAVVSGFAIFRGVYGKSNPAPDP